MIMTKEQRTKSQKQPAAIDPDLDPLRDIIGEPIDLPSVPDAQEAPPIEPQTEVEPVAIDEKDGVSITVPLGPLHDGYLSRHVQAQLDDRQRRNMRRMLQGLRLTGAKTISGKFVETPADAVRWMLEQLG